MYFYLYRHFWKLICLYYGEQEYISLHTHTHTHTKENPTDGQTDGRTFNEYTTHDCVEYVSAVFFKKFNATHGKTRWISMGGGRARCKSKGFSFWMAGWLLVLELQSHKSTITIASRVFEWCCACTQIVCVCVIFIVVVIFPKYNQQHTRTEKLWKTVKKSDTSVLVK